MNKTLATLKSKKNKKGFTLMEMLIVVAIIAILVAIAIPTFSGALNNAKKATDQANIRAAYADHQVYVLMHETDSTVADATISGTTITYPDKSTYTLQYFASVTTTSNPWVGAEK